MKGKIIFVVGAAVGYVLGSRAGRERYEQIKSAAGSLWASKPVQNGVGQAKGFVSDAVGDVPQQIFSAGRKAVAKMIGGPDESAKSAKSSAATNKSTSASSRAAKPSTTKAAAAKPAAKRTTTTTTKSSASDD